MVKYKLRHTKAVEHSAAPVNEIANYWFFIVNRTVFIKFQQAIPHPTTPLTLHSDFRRSTSPCFSYRSERSSSCVLSKNFFGESPELRIPPRTRIKYVIDWPAIESTIGKIWLLLGLIGVSVVKCQQYFQWTLVQTKLSRPFYVIVTNLTHALHSHSGTQIIQLAHHILQLLVYMLNICQLKALAWPYS